CPPRRSSAITLRSIARAINLGFKYWIWGLRNREFRGAPPRLGIQPEIRSDFDCGIANRSKSNQATLGHRYSTARVSKRLHHRTAACLRARYCTGLTCSDLDRLFLKTILECLPNRFENWRPDREFAIC